MKRRWVCPEPDCGVGSFVEDRTDIAPGRAVMTTRAGLWATREVGAEVHTVAYAADLSFPRLGGQVGCGVGPTSPVGAVVGCVAISRRHSYCSMLSPADYERVTAGATPAAAPVDPGNAGLAHQPLDPLA